MRITACITAHPVRLRSGRLGKAIQSVLAQELQPSAVIVSNDIDRLGAGANRQRILDQVDTPWMAWLDSDDIWYPNHLARLALTAQATGAGFVFPWFDAPGDPLGHFGKPFDPAAPHHTTITFLVRTELARKVGFPVATSEGPFGNEDWAHIAGLAELAVQGELLMVHLPERTWYWTQEGQNTSGVPGQGDSRKDMQ